MTIFLREIFGYLMKIILSRTRLYFIGVYNNCCFSACVHWDIQRHLQAGSGRQWNHYIILSGCGGSVPRSHVVQGPAAPWQPNGRRDCCAWRRMASAYCTRPDFPRVTIFLSRGKRRRNFRETFRSQRAGWVEFVDHWLDRLWLTVTSSIIVQRLVLLLMLLSTVA